MTRKNKQSHDSNQIDCEAHEEKKDLSYLFKRRKAQTQSNLNENIFVSDLNLVKA